MKREPKFLFILFTLTIFLAYSPSFSATVYQNFGIGNTFNEGGGWVVGSTTGFGDVASIFSTPSVDHYFTSVELAMSLPQLNPADDLYVWIMQDNSGSPGSVIEELFYDGVIPPYNSPGIIELNSSTNFILEADSSYWIGAGRTPAYSSGATPANVVWHYSLSSVNDVGSIYTRNPEGDWSFFAPTYKGTFRINGTAVPVPAAVWLLGTGLIGLIGFRKKFKK